MSLHPIPVLTSRLALTAPPPRTHAPAHPRTHTLRIDNFGNSTHITLFSAFRVDYHRVELYTSAHGETNRRLYIPPTALLYMPRAISWAIGSSGRAAARAGVL